MFNTGPYNFFKIRRNSFIGCGKMVDQIVTTYKVAGKPVNTWVSGIMSGIKRNEFSEYRIPDRKQSYL